MSARAILLMALTAFAWGYGSVASASMEAAAPPSGATVLSSESVLLTQSGASTTPLDITGPGELFVTLTDLQFPTSFSSLQYAISDTVSTLVKPTAAGIMTTLDLTAPTTLYVNVFATVASGSAGLYNLTATFVSAVPLPGSALSFIGGALLLGTLGFRRNAAARA